MHFSEKDHTGKEPFSSPHIKGILYPQDLFLLMLTLVTCVCPTSSFTYCALWKKDPHLRSRELCFSSLMMEYLCKLFGILLHGRFVCSPSLVYLVTGSSFYWLLASLIYLSVLIFDHYLIFQHYQMFQVHLVYFLPQSQDQPFLQEALVPFTEECFQKQRSGDSVYSLLLHSLLCLGFR